MKKVLILTDTLPWGHRSIARAIYSYLRPREKELGIRVEYAEVKAETAMMNQLYTLMYRFSPKMYRIVHKLGQQKLGQELVAAGSIFNLPRLKSSVSWHKPDIIISAYFLHSHALQQWRLQETQKWQLWTIVADPWTMNPATLVKGADKHLVYDEVGREQLVGMGDKTAVVTGWWVRPEMYQKYNREKIRKQWGIIDNRPIVFVGGGSLGTNSIRKLLPALLMVDKPVGVIINTGTDKLAYRMVNEFCRLFARLKRENLVVIRNLGWIENMAEVLSACDIVLGKAGPNFLFDVVAVGKPFVAITHIGGQEDGNIDLIKKKKLGWVKEKRGELAKFFLSYVDQPERYNNKYSQTIKAEAERNRVTMVKIVELIKKSH